MAEENSGEKIPTFLKRPISRRNFLRGTTLGAAGLAAAAVIGTNKANEKVTVKPPENLPDDVLSKEELERANITIYNTKDVLLYIRKSALEMPAFSDALQGKNGGLVIALVDDRTMTWDALDRLPQDARLIAQSTRVHPSDLPEGYWDEYFKLKGPEVQKKVNEYQQDLNDYLSGKKETEIKKAISDSQKRIKEAEARGKDTSGHQESLMFWQNRLASLGESEKRVRFLLSGRQEELKRIREFEKDPKARTEYLLKKNDVAKGQYVTRQAIENLLNDENIMDPLDDFYPSPVPIKQPTARYDYIEGNHPEWLNRTYFYICVGKQHKPRPSESFQGPNDFDVSEEDKKLFGYHVTPKGKPEGDPNTGFALRHEIGHYGPDKHRNEAEADDFAYQTLVAAWEKYNQTGDNSGYSFIFATKEGLTYTKDLEADKSAKPKF